MFHSRTAKGVFVLLVAMAVSACGGKGFDLGVTGTTFKQESISGSVPIDVLWVIDNSGSMATSQQYLAQNFQGFINNFQQTNFDFRMAVVTTEGYLSMAAFGGGSSWSRFKDRHVDPNTLQEVISGVHVMTPQTANLSNVFQINVSQGIEGNADERGLQSMEQALLNTDNIADGFPRPGAFLAVIVMSDEEDFSHPGTANIQFKNGLPNTVNDPELTPVSYYEDFLDQLTNSTEATKNYMFNTIGIFDQTCLDDLSTTFTGRRITERYAELTDASGGVKGSLCGDFNDILSSISDTIFQQSTKFYLNKEAVIETLQVVVDGVEVPANGYVYDPVDYSITFQPGFIPPSGASIQVFFQPTSV